MRTHGIRRKLAVARKNVDFTIRISINPDNPFSALMAREGYLGGYSDALSDVDQALNGNHPKRRGFWNKREK